MTKPNRSGSNLITQFLVFCPSHPIHFFLNKVFHSREIIANTAATATKGGNNNRCKSNGAPPRTSKLRCDICQQRNHKSRSSFAIPHAQAATPSPVFQAADSCSVQSSSLPILHFAAALCCMLHAMRFDLAGLRAVTSSAKKRGSAGEVLCTRSNRARGLTFEARIHWVGTLLRCGNVLPSLLRLSRVSRIVACSSLGSCSAVSTRRKD